MALAHDCTVGAISDTENTVREQPLNMRVTEEREREMSERDAQEHADRKGHRQRNRQGEKSDDSGGRRGERDKHMRDNIAACVHQSN